MKKAGFFTLLMIMLLVLSGVSCKSSPKVETPEEQPVVATPSGPSQAALDVLKASIAKVDAARKQASDFEGPGYFPSEWETAEAQYAAAWKMPQGTDSDVRQAAAAYDALVGTYDGIFNNALPLYAQAREDEIMAARSDVMASGIVPVVPDFFSSADKTALDALEQYENGDYYAARDSAADALLMYKTLNTGADCWKAWQEITDRGFDSYSPDVFDTAEGHIDTAVEQYMEGDFASAHNSAEKALQAYDEVLRTGWVAYSSQLAASATAERQAALDVKGNIAVRDMFNEADVIYHQAGNVLKDENYDEAAALYTEAEARFIMVSVATGEKRRIAADTIREANEIIEMVTETARQVDLENEGGSR